MSTDNRLRQPTGTPVGGQFAPDPNSTSAAPVALEATGEDIGKRYGVLKTVKGTRGLKTYSLYRTEIPDVGDITDVTGFFGRGVDRLQSELYDDRDHFSHKALSPYFNVRDMLRHSGGWIGVDQNTGVFFVTQHGGDGDPKLEISENAFRYLSRFMPHKESELKYPVMVRAREKMIRLKTRVLELEKEIATRKLARGDKDSIKELQITHKDAVYTAHQAEKKFVDRYTGWYMDVLNENWEAATLANRALTKRPRSNSDMFKEYLTPQAPKWLEEE